MARPEIILFNLSFCNMMIKEMDIRLKIILVVLLIAVFIQPFIAMRNFGPVTDEITHLPSGYSYWKTGEIRLNPQHPPLIKLISAIPLLFMDLKFPTSAMNHEWTFGKEFLYQNNADQILFWGRIPAILVSVLLAFYVFKWSLELFGPKAGIFALFLYAFTPDILAHSQFVTTDMGVTAFSFITIYYLWKLVKERSRKNLVLTGIGLGLALGAKFSGVLLLPLIPLLALIHFWQEKTGFSKKFFDLLKLTTPVFTLAFILIYVFYLFPADIGFYKNGLESLYKDRNPNYFYYLNGEFKSEGWWYYFILAFLMKVPVPILVFIAASLILWKKFKMNISDRLFLFLPTGAFLIFTSFWAHNIGIRYLLPIYPFLIIYSSGLVNLDWFKNSRIRKKIGLVSSYILMVWLVFGTILIHPDYLAYFNELAGGPENGYQRLDDSNIEWGQDLKRLAEYQKKYPNAKVVYPWRFVDLNYYGIKNNLFEVKENWWTEPSGRYVVSVYFLIRAKLSSQVRQDPSLDWLSLYEPVDRVGYSYLVYEFK